MNSEKVIAFRMEPSERRLLSLPWGGADEGLDRLSHRRRDAEEVGWRSLIR